MAVDNPCRCPRPFQVDDGCVKCGRTINWQPPEVVVDDRPRCVVCKARMDVKATGRPRETCGANRCGQINRARKRKARELPAASIQP